MRARSLLLCLTLGAALGFSSSSTDAHGWKSTDGTLTAVSPPVVVAGQDVTITGTGFHPDAHDNEVFFVAPNGTTVSARAHAIREVDGSEPRHGERQWSHTQSRRLTVRVPAGAATGHNAIRVVDRVDGGVSTGKSVEVRAGSNHDNDPTSAAGKITAVNPLKATPGQEITVTGTGFHPSAQHNEVFFIPQSGGLAVSAKAHQIERLGNEPSRHDRTKVHPGIRRLTVRVPDGVHGGGNALRVVDLVHDIVAEGKSIEIVSLLQIDPDNAPRGTTGLAVTVEGSSGVRFVAGKTDVSFGAGITTRQVTVQSPTRLVVTIDIAHQAEIGPRTVTLEVDGAHAGSGSGGSHDDDDDHDHDHDGHNDHGNREDRDNDRRGNNGWNAGYNGSGGPNDRDGDRRSKHERDRDEHRRRHNGCGYVRYKLINGFEVTDTTDPPVNAAPSVNAGPDRSITLPTTVAALAGTAGDDGLPAGSTLQVSWSMVSGPGAAAFADAASASTTATLTVAGTYVLRLTATDGTLSNADEVSVVVHPAPPANLAPVVDAGPNKTTTLPNANVALAGTASDDGQPAGSPLQIAWTVAGGPGTVSFANAAAASTTATFTVAGSYVLRLSATDGALSGLDEVSVTVNPAEPVNEAPTVSAGPDQEVTLPAGIALAGSASDDGLPAGSTTSVTWSLASGSGVTFGNAHAASTTATFAGAGTYLLRLTATDSALSSSDDISVTVHPAPATNHAPSVNAGSDQSITQPQDVVQLSAVVTDDGLPSGSSLTVSWSASIGPAPVSFSHAASKTTSVTLTVPGVYVLTVTATDGELSASDTISVTVSTPPLVNQPPSVSAGPDGALTFPTNAYALGGTATDDGQPASPGLSVRWNVASGPQPVSFADQHATTTTATFAAPGSYVLRLTATDGAHSVADEVTIVVNPGAAPPAANQPPVAHAGGPYTGDAKSPVAVSGVLSSDPDGDAITYAWTFGDGANGSGAVAQHAFANAGTYTVTLTVTDAGGQSRSATTQATIGPEADRAPPSINLLAAHEALPGAPVPVTAAVSDNVGVASVQFFVNNQPAGADSSEPFQHTVTVPALATPGTTIAIRGVATDASGNTGSHDTQIVITAAPDATPPAVSVNAPPTAAPGSTVMVSAQATDATGIASVGFTRDGQAIGVDSLPPYTASFVVPAGATAGSLIVVGARASDAAGNVGDGSATVRVVVVADADTAPPTVDVTAPSTAPVGGAIDIAAQASDNISVAQVRLSVDGVAIATLAAPPYTAHYTLTTSRTPGSVLTVRAEATDSAGLTAADVTTTIVTGTAGAGVILGEVYNDDSGLPLADADVAIAAVDGSTPPVATRSGARGAYAADGVGGVRITISKPGFTTVERTVAVPDSATAQPIDARLTPLSPATFAVSSALGRAIETSNATLTIVPGALAADATLVLTPIGPQGLRGLLPVGWSPVAALDIAPAGLALSLPALLTISNLQGAPAASTLTLAQWDIEAGAWRAVAATTVVAGTPLEATVEATGQYAWLLADQSPAVPPTPAVGEVLASSLTLGAIPDTATMTISPQPKIAVYTPSVRSDVTAHLMLETPMASGAVVHATVSEAYQFASTPVASPDPFIADLVLYQFPGSATSPRAKWTASPSLVFEAADLLKGLIALDLNHDGPTPETVPVVGASGGSASADTGETLTLPAGAVTGATPIAISRIGADALGVTLGSGLELVGAVQIVIPRSDLLLPGSLSVPRPAALVDDAGIFLLRLVELGGSTHPIFVGIGRIAGNLVVSSVDVAGIATPLDGVRGSGRYLFARAKVASGYATGKVLRSAAPAPGALVTSSGWPIAAIARADGGYTLPVVSGNLELSAIDFATTDRVTVATAVAPGAIVTRSLLLQVQPPRILTVSPAMSATNVPLGAAVVLTVSEPVQPATVEAAVRLETSGGTRIAATVTLSNGGRVITLRASDPLTPDSIYVVRVTTALADLSGHVLAAALVSQFTSLDTTAPAPPPAGNITATLPVNGQTTVSGTQGSASLHDTVRIVNLTKGTFVPALVNPNGSFSATIAATLADKLIVTLVDQNGNETAVPIPAFSQTNVDGGRTTVVGAEGGRVQGPNGIVVDVPEQALPDGTPLTITPVSEASFPVQLTAQQRQDFAFSGGVALDFGGDAPASYVNVSIPAGEGDKRSDRWVVVAIAQVAGRAVMSAVDTAQIIDGRITTSSPPCPGVLAAATYGFIKSTRQPVGVIYTDQRNLVNAQVTFMQLVQEGGLSQAAANVIPWGVTSASLFPQPQCFPVLIGRSSVTPNSQRIAVQASEFLPADRTLVVKNTTLGTELHFPRNVVEYRFPVDGSVDDSFAVQAISIGNPATVPFDVAPLSPGRVLIRVDMDKVTTQVTEVVVRNLTKTPVGEWHFPQSVVPATVRMAGGASDAYEVTVVNSSNVARVVSFTVQSTTGAGNLVARVLPGTIDPGTTVTLVNRTSNAETSIPTELYADDGGFEFPFDGAIGDLYKLVIKQDNVAIDHVYMPAVRIIITNPETGRPMREVVVPAPPIDDPTYNLGVLSNDTTAPLLIGSPNGLTSFDPNGVLSFTFSEGIDRDSAMSGVQLKDDKGMVVAGEVRLSAGNTVVTYVPAAALKLGKKYTITLTGLRDGSGNALPTQTLELTTFAPKKTYTTAELLGLTGYFRDMVFLDRSIGNGEVLRRAYAIVNDIQKSSLAVLDMTKAGEPVVLSHQLGPNSNIAIVTGLQNVTLRDVVTACGVGPLYSGDLLVTSNHDTGSVSLQFWDLTNPDAPCMMGSKLIVNNPSLGLVKGSVPGMGVARGLTALKTNDHVYAYAAVGQVGLFQVDIGLHSPRRNPQDTGREPLASGNYDDVITIRGPLLAATERTAYQLDIFDPSLAMLASVPLGPSGNEATQTTYAENFGIDKNADGIVDAQERHDIVFIGGTAGIVAVDVTNADQAHVLGTIAMPGFAYEVQVDATRRRLFVFGTQTKAASGKTLFIIDLSAPDPFTPMDHDNDGIDDRIIWQSEPGAFPDTGIGAQRSLLLDAQRGLVYLSESGPIGTTSKLGVWSVYNMCCDLGVAMQRELDLPDTSDPLTALEREKRALQKGLTAGLAAAASCGVTVRSPGSSYDPNAVAILEQGSGACVWKTDIVKACGTTYQPGLSDHDFEVFIPAAQYPGSETTGAACVTKKLNEQFTTADGTPKPIELENGVTVVFQDITFFAVKREPFEQAKLDVLPPASSGTDASGDIGLGRQQLLLKWLLEGEYVGLTTYDVAGKPLDDILARLRDVTQVPVVEGFEWGVLQRYNLAKSKAFLRVRGASDTLSAFYPLFVAQLHDAGKSGIRAALARMMADPAAAAIVLDITRGDYAGNGCYAIPYGSSKGGWGTKVECRGFEQYIASAAARTVIAELPIFTDLEVSTLIQRFYEAKADAGDRITTEPEADQFIASVAQFVDRVVSETQAAYDAALPADPDATQRASNMTAALSATTKALKGARLHVVPQVFNFSFTGAEQVEFTMYRGAPASVTGDKVKTVHVTLQPNELRTLRTAADTKLPEPADGISAADRNLLDLSKTSTSDLNPLFMLGEKDSALNPPVDLTQNIGLNRYVAFTLDLPARSFKEAFRDNNVGGFFYYVLDRVNAVSDQPPPTIPLPIADPDGKMLEPDPDCSVSADLQISQAVLKESIDEPANPEVVSDFVVVDPNEVVHVRLRVKNDAGITLEHVKACSSLRPTEPCLDAGTLAVGEEKDVLFDWTAPAESQFIEAIATANAAGVGTRRSPSMGIAVGCEPYLVIPSPNFVSPLLGTPGAQVMRGGQAIRHYRVVDKNSGWPAPGIVIEVEVTATGQPIEIRHYVSDLDGNLGTGGESAVIVPVPADLHEAGHTITGRITKVQAKPAYCQSNLTLFEINVTDRQFTRNYNAGANIEVKGAVSKGLSGKAGLGFGVSIGEIAGKGPQSLSVSRQVGQEAGVVAEVMGAELGVYLGGKAKLSAKVEAGATAALSRGDSHELPYNQGTKQLDANERAVFGALMLATTTVGVNGHPFIRKLLDTAGGLANPAPFRVSTTDAVSAEIAGSATYEGTLGLGAKDKAKSIQLGLEASIGGDLKFGVGIALTDDIKANEFIPSVDVKGGLEVSAQLGVAKPGDSETTKDKKKSVVDKWKLGMKGSVMATMKASVTLDRTDKSKVKKLSFSFSNPKKFGFKADAAGFSPIGIGFGDKQGISFSVTNETHIKAMLAQLAIVKRAALPFLDSLPDGTTPVVNDAGVLAEIEKLFEMLIKSDADYVINEELGQAVSLPVGFDITVGPATLEIKGVPALDTSIGYLLESGVVKNGKLYALARYTNDELLPDFSDSGADFLALANLSYDGLAALAGSAFDQVLGVFGAGVQTLKSNFTAELTYNGTGETPFTPSIHSWHFEPDSTPTPTGHRIYRPGDFQGPPDRPHYGIGHFHQFAPSTKVLANPATMTISYGDAEVAAFDESALAVYRWNDTTGDWDHLGGTPDPVNNTVTAPIDRLGLYTAAPPMPAGTIALDAQSQASGPGGVSVAYTASGLKLNTGAPVPDGTLYTVMASTPGLDFAQVGSVLTTDADPQTPGAQVAAVNGAINFAIHYDAAGQAMVLVFSREGTALSTQLLPVGNQ